MIEGDREDKQCGVIRTTERQEKREEENNRDYLNRFSAELKCFTSKLKLIKDKHTPPV